MYIWKHTNGIDIIYFYIYPSIFIFLYPSICVYLHIYFFFSWKPFFPFHPNFPPLVTTSPLIFWGFLGCCHELGCFPRTWGDTIPLSQAEMSRDRLVLCPSQEHPCFQGVTQPAFISQIKGEVRFWGRFFLSGGAGHTAGKFTGHWALCAGMGRLSARSLKGTWQIFKKKKKKKNQF